MSQHGAPGLLARTYAWAVLAVHPLVPVAWIAAVVVATLTLPSLGGASSAPLEDLVAKDSPALAAQERSAALFGEPARDRHGRRPAQPARAHPRRAGAVRRGGAGRRAAARPAATSPG